MRVATGAPLFYRGAPVLRPQPPNTVPRNGRRVALGIATNPSPQRPATVAQNDDVVTLIHGLSQFNRALTGYLRPTPQDPYKVSADKYALQTAALQERPSSADSGIAAATGKALLSLSTVAYAGEELAQKMATDAKASYRVPPVTLPMRLPDVALQALAPLTGIKEAQ